MKQLTKHRQAAAPQRLYKINHNYLHGSIIHQEPTTGWTLTLLGSDLADGYDEPIHDVKRVELYLSPSRPMIFENQQAIDQFCSDFGDRGITRFIKLVRLVKHQRFVLTVEELSYQLQGRNEPKWRQRQRLKRRVVHLLNHVTRCPEDPFRAPLLRPNHVSNNLLLRLMNHTPGVNEFQAIKRLELDSAYYELGDPKFFLTQEYATLPVQRIDESTIKVPGGRLNAAIVDAENPRQVYLVRKVAGVRGHMRTPVGTLPAKLKRVHLVELDHLGEPFYSITDTKQWRPLRSTMIPLDLLAA